MSRDNTPKKLGRPVRVPGEPDTKEKILAAAIRLFSERGYEGTSIRRITRDVGITESALYRHFRGKEELLEAIIALTERMVNQPLSGIDEKPTGDTSVFRKLFETPADALGENPLALEVSRFFFMECPRNERVRNYLKQAMEEQADAEVSRILADEIRKGSIAPLDTEAVAHIVNLLRFQWSYKVSVLDRDTAYDPEKSRRDLDPVIRFFEELYSPEHAGTRSEA